MTLFITELFSSIWLLNTILSFRKQSKKSSCCHSTHYIAFILVISSRLCLRHYAKLSGHMNSLKQSLKCDRELCGQCRWFTELSRIVISTVSTHIYQPIFMQYKHIPFWDFFLIPSLEQTEDLLWMKPCHLYKLWKVQKLIHRKLYQWLQ